MRHSGVSQSAAVGRADGQR